MKCKNCGNEIQENDEFCGNCGTKVKTNEPIKIKFNYFLIGVLGFVVILFIVTIGIYFANNNSEGINSSVRGISNQNTTKEYYDFIDKTNGTFIFTEEELIYTLCGGKDYKALGLTKYPSSNDKNTTLYTNVSLNGFTSIISIKTSTNNFKVSEFSLSTIKMSNYDEESIMQEIYNELLLGVTNIVLARDKNTSVTEQQNQEIDEIFNELYLNDGKYKGLNISYSKDLRETHSYFKAYK